MPLPLPLTPADREERRRRIEALRRQVARGEYRVPAEDVAAAIVEHFSAGLRPRRAE
jgi:anti-sigma28 factor (negative regulator of flagellin synthesis)